jgi:hypothetical protein
MQEQAEKMQIHQHDMGIAMRTREREAVIFSEKMNVERHTLNNLFVMQDKQRKEREQEREQERERERERDRRQMQEVRRVCPFLKENCDDTFLMFYLRAQMIFSATEQADLIQKQKRDLEQMKEVSVL